MRRVLIVVEFMSLTLVSIGCGSTGTDHRNSAVRIVHAVLPPGAPATPASGTQSNPAVGAHTIPEDPLSDLVRWAGSGEDGDAEALIIAGNFESVGGDAAASAQLLIKALGLAPAALPIYLVPGTRELRADELPSAALGAAHAVIGDVQKQLDATADRARVTNLAACYTAPASSPASCVAQLPGRRIRLVGYPGYYVGATPAKGAAEEQQKWAAAFQQAMGAQQNDVTTVLVAPLFTPVSRHWAPDASATRTTWMQSARAAQAALGIAGSGPMRRALYETGEHWTEAGLEGTWFLTPPLAVPASSENQPALGASVISVAMGEAVQRQVFWYAPRASAFRATRAAASEVSADQSPFAPSWLWGLGDSLGPLPKASVFLIAFLAAFLTSVAVWQIPPAASNVTVTATAPATSGQSSSTTIAIPQSLMDKWAPASFIQQNFARTVLSGLGGLAVATLTLEAVGQTDKAPAQAFYLVWFIVWFFVFLVVSSLARAATEGLRAISYVGRQKPVMMKWRLPKLWIGWFLLTASDAFFNLIQGKNDLKSTIWADEIRSNQEDSLLAIDRVTEHLRSGLVETVRGKTGANVDLADIRVAVSVLADDGKRVYYVSWPPESSSREFGTNSVAYITVAAGVTRWWQSGYETQNPPVILFDNKAGELSLEKKELLLREFFQARGRDYNSFIVFPVPSRPSDITRQAGLHISFKEAAWVSAIWPKAVLGTVPNTYDTHGEILDGTVIELNRLLRQSIHVIESVLRSFNENVFEKDLRSRRRS